MKIHSNVKQQNQEMYLLNYTDKTLWKSPFDIYFRHCQYMFSGIIHDL